jgi:hypothetical protein
VELVPTQEKQKTPPLPCVTVPLNLLETDGTRRVAFDFQLRPVGHNLNYCSVYYLLRFKDIVSNHVHRQGKFSMIDLEFPLLPKNQRFLYKLPKTALTENTLVDLL